MDVAFGVDTHKSTLQVSAADRVGGTIRVQRFPNRSQGHADMLDWIRSMSQAPMVGIECSGNFGAALAKFLIDAGLDVREVPGQLSWTETRSRGRGKTDTLDAEAIARVVVREGSRLPAARNGVNEELRLLSDHRSRLVVQRAAEINRVHGFMVHLRPGYEAEIPRVRSEKSLAAVTMMLRGDRSVRADLVRHSVAEIRRLTKEIKKVEQQIQNQLDHSSSTLQNAVGISSALAARILGEIGDPRALRSAAGFARLTGVAPLPASSGQVVRHRHNRGGNRKLNRAIHMIAVNRCRLDEATKQYMAKKRAEGKSGREAMRALKRHIANDLFRTIKRDCQQQLATAA